MPNNPIKALYSLPELCQISGLPIRSIRRLLKENGIAAIYSGKKQYIPLSQIYARLYDFGSSIELVEMWGHNGAEVDETDTE